MNQKPAQLLICDDDSLFHLTVKHCLKGYVIHSAKNGDEALFLMNQHPIDLMLLDVQMRSQSEGLDYIPKFLAVDPDLVLVMSSGNVEFHAVKKAMQLGATDYLPKDFEPDELILVIERALTKKRLIQRSRQQNSEAKQHQLKHILIGDSTPTSHLRNSLQKVRGSWANVLITGETGTGKEVVARQLRKSLPDGTLEPFVAVDSSTIQGSTAESHLFGHEKGAFTGADQTKKGVFEEANGGVVYFDEIGNMPLEIQSKLLRALQEKEISRLGSPRSVALEFRVICATNKDLDRMCERGEFKHDLLQRINVIPIELAPLRDRLNDIPLLVDHFVRKHNVRLKFGKDVLEAFAQYSWPGNVRELENIINYLAAMSEGESASIEDLPAKIRKSSPSGAQTSNAISPVPASDPADLCESFYIRVAAFEKALLQKEFLRSAGNISKLSTQLKMDRSHLYKKLKEYDIYCPQR